MHMNLRRYQTVGVNRSTIEEAVVNELLPVLKADPGFEAYYAFWDDLGAGVSVSGFADAAVAHTSTSVVRRWLASHTDFFPARGEEFSGECFVQKVAPRDARAEGRPYVLVRLLSGVPATQDTRAFVEQRTLPLIERWPGFRAVWMARSDRDIDGAAVATFFDGPGEAIACHEAAVLLLREGLPSVSVAQMAHGYAAIADSSQKART
jgi:hypothetical protein